MLDLVFGLMLATSGLTNPVLDTSGLDRRRPETTQSVELGAETAQVASGDDHDRTGDDGPGVLGGPLNR